ncbi:Uncharacterised protein [BD1-7 clade bacterium]|uniref:Uracil-DNA glycosylase-like domain-containing protein n=1 Tax=BD1-7 clade bacterium TaxID=2029982 RepID=A0A5S9P4Y0_9GAMM|nr:Uncharacterised protein [BD1-7 clade bacterium]CAA0098494.1 Uncharacterised protein [BD1-7 clade bacterium]
MKHPADNALVGLLDDIAQCRLCETDFGFTPRPVVQVSPNAKILIAGQAPGRKVHESGIPFNDASGERLRDWMGIDKDTFYSDAIAIVPMAFCFPGTGKSGDLPPPAICAKTWRGRVLEQLPERQLTLLVGHHAMKWHLPELKRSTLTDIVSQWQSFSDGTLPLPHPSPRNQYWLKKHPWFEQELLPQLKVQVQKALSAD